MDVLPFVISHYSAHLQMVKMDSCLWWSDLLIIMNQGKIKKSFESRLLIVNTDLYDW